MSSKYESIISNFRDALGSKKKKKTNGYSTVATVKRVDGDTVYVEIPGGYFETPVNKTMDAKPGDNVQVMISGNRAFLVGNATAPPTDNTFAKEVADKTATDIAIVNDLAIEAGKTADRYIVDIGDMGVRVRSASNNSNYVDITSNGMDVIANGERVASYGKKVVIGKESDYRTILSPDEFHINGGENNQNADLFSIQKSGNPTGSVFSKTLEVDGQFAELEDPALVGSTIRVNVHAYLESSDNRIDLGLNNTYFIYGTSDTKDVTVYWEQNRTVVTLSYDSDADLIAIVNVQPSSTETAYINTVTYTATADEIDLGRLVFGSLSEGFGNATASLGLDLIAYSDNQTVVGRLNEEYAGPFVVGCGDSGGRKNALTVDWSGNTTALGELITKKQYLDLGKYTAAGILTNAARELKFSIPTGRVFPSDAYVAWLEFDILVRASNSNGPGMYIVREVDETITSTHFNSKPSTVLSFYNGAKQPKNLGKTQCTISLEGGTNIVVKFDPGVSDFFSGNSTNTGYINNNAATVELQNIEAFINLS